MTPRVIRTRKEAEDHNPNEPAVVEVPGELVRSVFVLTKALKTSANGKQKKLIKALLSTGARLP